MSEPVKIERKKGDRLHNFWSPLTTSRGVTPYVWHSTDVRPNTPPFFSAARYTPPLFLIKKVYEWPVFWVLAFKWPNFSDTHVYAHIFARILVKPLFSHLHKAVFRMTRVICKLIYKSQRIWNGILNQRIVYEYRSTFCVIKYLNRLLFVCF